MDRDQRFVEILLGLTLILLGVGSILDGFIIIGLLLLPMGIFLLARNGAPGRVWVEQILKFLNDVADEFFMIVDGGSNRSASALTTRERQQQSPPTAADDSPRQRIFKHALLALRLSGHDPDRIGILPVDIGLMAFSAHKMPEIYRTRSVPSDVDYIQPFIVLNLPTGAVGRVRQGVRALSAWAKPVDHALVEATLAEPLRVLFYRMRRSEQLHSLNVLRRVMAAGEAPAALRVAALLHDCGKARAPFSLPERVIVVLVKAAAPSLAKQWGAGDESGLRTWRRPFVLSAQHPAWGAAMAELAGAE